MRKAQEVFDKNFREKAGALGLSVLSDFVQSSNHPVELKCRECGDLISLAKASSMCGCDYCKTVARRIPLEDFLKFLEEFYPELTYISGFKRYKSFVTLRCEDGHLFITTPSRLKQAYKGNFGGCSKCHSKTSKVAMSWLKLVSKKVKERVIHAKNSLTGEWDIGDRFCLDGYIQKYYAGLEFEGSYYHGDPNWYLPDDILRKDNNCDPYLAKYAYAKTMTKLNKVLDSNKIAVWIWENDYYKNPDHPPNIAYKDSNLRRAAETLARRLKSVAVQVESLDTTMPDNSADPNHPSHARKVRRLAREAKKLEQKALDEALLESESSSSTDSCYSHAHDSTCCGNPNCECDHNCTNKTKPSKRFKLKAVLKHKLPKLSERLVVVFAEIMKAFLAKLKAKRTPSKPVPPPVPVPLTPTPKPTKQPELKLRNLFASTPKSK